jgi:hypothetical protein
MEESHKPMDYYDYYGHPIEVGDKVLHFMVDRKYLKVEVGYIEAYAQSKLKVQKNPGDPYTPHSFIRPDRCIVIKGVA